MSIGVWDAAWLRVSVSAAVGVAVGIGAGMVGHSIVSAILGWIAAAAVYNVWTWVRIGHMDAESTRTHATREDGSRQLGNIVVIVASLLAIVGVGVLIAASSTKKGGAGLEALIGVLAIAGAWFTVHTLFTLRYAHLYFNEGGKPVDFNSDDDPTYADFAYLGFTVGMTYQVSDTSIDSRAIRHTILRHALVSFMLGAVIIGATINLVSQLASSGG